MVLNAARSTQHATIRARLSSISNLPDDGSSAGGRTGALGTIDTGIRGRCCASTLPASAKNLAPLVQLIGIDSMRLREAGNGVVRSAGLLACWRLNSAVK